MIGAMLPIYENAVVVCGSGPSFNKEAARIVTAARRAKRVHVIAVNDTYRILESPHVVYAADEPWWRLHSRAVSQACKDSAWLSSDVNSRAHGAGWLPTKPGAGLAPERAPYVMRGTSSGFQAVGLAIMRGARRIILAGMDCQASEDGAAHFFGEHPQQLNRFHPFEVWREEFDGLAEPARARGIDIVVCGRTAIGKLRHGDLREEVNK